MSMTDRIEAKWIDMFVEVFALCGVKPGDVVTSLSGQTVEILNTDAEAYGGGNRGNLGGVATEKTPWHGQSQSALVSLPPLSAVYLQQD